MITDVELADLVARLRERFTLQPVPPCRVCDGPLGQIDEDRTLSASFRRYACRNRPIPNEHYADSVWIQRPTGDADVLALLDLIAGGTEIRWGVRDAQFGDIWLLDEREANDYAPIVTGTVIRRTDLAGVIVLPESSVAS